MSKDKDRLSISGTIRVVRRTDTRKKDLDLDKGQLVIMDKHGLNKINITGPESIIGGFSPEEEVVVIVRSANEAISESS